MNPLILRPRVLASRIIAEVEQTFAQALGLERRHRALALLTCDMDDALFVAMDEATKAADVEVILAKSTYAGSDYPSGPLSGESFGMLASPDVEQAREGLRAALGFLERDVWFEQIDDDAPAYFAHVISRCGTFLAEEAQVPVGSSIAYLIAPPLEATFGIEAALKQNEVGLAKWYEPPTETNFAGALLTGEQSAVSAAAETFRAAIAAVSRAPFEETL